MYTLHTCKDFSVTLKDIAALTGFSVSTVSRALRNDPRISERTKTVVLWAARQVGYVPSGYQHLRSISLVVINPHKGSLDSDEFFNSVQRGILDSAVSSNIPCIVNMVQPDNPNSFNIPLEIINGIIIGGIPMPSFIKKFLQSCQLPVVLIGKYEGLNHLPSVNNDNIRGGFLAAQEILSHGYKNVVVLTGPLGISTFADRVEGAMNAFKRCESFLNKVRVIECKGFDERDGREAIISEREFFKFNPSTAIFATTDWLAKGALEALRTLKISVPQEVGIIGFGGLELCRCTIPQLSSVQLNPYLIGKIAFLLLSELMNGNSECAGTIFVEPTILKGATLCQQ